MTIAVDLDFDGKKNGTTTGFDSQLSLYNIKSDVNFHLNSTFNQLIDGADGGTTSTLPGKAGDDNGYENDIIYQSGREAANNFAGVAGLNLSELAAVNFDNLSSGM